MRNLFAVGGFEKRLAALFLLLSVPPTLLIAFFSARYFMESVQLVSNPGVEQSFSNSVEIARDFSLKLQEDAKCIALRLADEYRRAGSPAAGGGSEALEEVLARVRRETHADFAACYVREGAGWALAASSPAGFPRLDRRLALDPAAPAAPAGSSPDSTQSDVSVARPGAPPAGTGEPAPTSVRPDSVRLAPTGPAPIRLASADPDVIASGVAADRTLLVAGFALERGFTEKMRRTADDLGRYRAVGLYVSMKRRYIIIVTTVLVVLVAVASALLSRLVARRISHPITELAAATARVAKGDLDYRVDVPARDEVLSLVQGFNKMTEELQENRSNLILAAKREAEVARDFQIAREVQTSLFPTALPLIPGWEFATTCRTAKVVGGDYHDVFEIARGKVLFALGDVMGKSVGASLTMASVHAVVRSAGAALGQEDTPLRLARELNRYLVTSHASEMLVTLFLGLIDCAQSRLWYVNCGHPPALRLREGEARPGELGVGGMVLGVTEEAKYETGECDFAPGDTLVLVSDGVTEAMNPRRELYGEERLVEILSGRQGLGAIENMQRILDSVDAFMEGSEQEDDISIVVLKRAF